MFKTKRTLRSLRAGVRSLTAQNKGLWKANKKLRTRVHQLEEHTKHVEAKLSNLHQVQGLILDAMKSQDIVNQGTLKGFKSLQKQVDALKPKKKETKKK